VVDKDIVGQGGMFLCCFAPDFYSSWPDPGP
jgi:hypothetical protein